MIIPGVKRARYYTAAYMDLTAWLKQKDAYLWNENNGELEFHGPENIFLVEKKEVSVFDQGGPRFTVMVSFFIKKNFPALTILIRY